MSTCQAPARVPVAAERQAGAGDRGPIPPLTLPQRAVQRTAAAPVDDGTGEEVSLPPELETLLPPEQWQKLNDAPRRGMLLNALDRLRSILYLLSTYLPQHLVQEKMRRPLAGRARGQWLSGSLLFADVSGFTALSERLAGLGSEGTEQLTAAINRYFGAMLDILGCSGGILLKFAGDALLAYFPEMSGGEQARWAVRAGQRMMAAMPQFAAIDTPLGPVALRMKIGVGTGGFLGASVGTDQRMEYVILGETVVRTMAAEGAAEAGLVVVDGATAAHLDATCCSQRSAGFFAAGVEPGGDLGEFEVRAGQRRARGAIPWSASPHAIVAQMEVALRQIQALTPYLASELVDQIVARARQRRIESENRLTTVAFVNFTGLEAPLSAWGRGGVRPVTGLLDDYFRAMHRVVAEQGGIVSRIDPYSQGSKMLILFGAPLAHEDDPWRAVSAARAMGQELDRLNERWRRRLAGSLPAAMDGPLLQQRVGISLGPTFAGQAGSATRREYTVMGDDVNLAARLMAAARPGQTLLSQRVYDAVVDRFRATPLPTIRVKGKSQPIAVYEAQGPRDDFLARRLQSRGPLIGRDAEVARGRAAVHRLLEGQGLLLAIYGEAGIGKSRMADEIAARALARGVRVLFSPCRTGASDAPYSAWLPLLHQLLGLDPAEPDQARGRSLSARLAELGLGEYADPLAKVLGLPPLDTAPPAGLPLQAGARGEQKPALFGRLEQKVAAPKEKNSGMDLWRLVQSRPIAPAAPAAGQAPQHSNQPGQMWQNLQARVTTRQQERLFEAVSGLVARLAAGGPLLLLFENAQGMDPASRALVDHLKGQVSKHPILIVVVQRGETAPAGGEEALVLEPLDREATMGLARHLLGDEQPRQDLIQAIYEQSGGNPLFVEEMARWWQRTEQSSREELKQGLGASYTVQELVLSHLDSLPLGQRDTLRCAAVAGVDFRYGEARALLPATVSDEALGSHLSGLEEARLVLLAQEAADSRYAFRQTVVHEVGYHSQSAGRRRELHARLAAYLEARRPAANVELLAFHYEQADRPLPAARYLLRSGWKAQQCYAHGQARAYYDRAWAAVNHLPAAERGPEAQSLAIRAQEGLGDVGLLTGDFGSALAAYRCADDTLVAGVSGGEGVAHARLLVKLALALGARGQAAAAWTHAQQAWAIHAADAALACAATLAWLSWRDAGAQAGAWLEQAKVLAAGESGPWAAGIGALLAHLGGEWAAARRAYAGLGRQVGVALVTCHEGDACLERGEPAAALALYEKAAGIWAQESDGTGLALAHYRQAEAHLRAGAGAAARTALLQAQTLMEKAGAVGAKEAGAIERARRFVAEGRSDSWPAWHAWPYVDSFHVSTLFRPGSPP